MLWSAVLASEVQSGSKIRAVVRVAAGNFLEMYDFTIFGYYAVAIGQTFFPSGSDFVSLMRSLMTFGAGYLMRPLGALVLGSYIDHHGRRKGLLLTLGLMAAGTLSIALMPGYASIGLLAPLLVLLGRLVQGLSAGVELGGVSVYLSEIAPLGRKGAFVCWQSGSQQVAVMLAAVMGIALALALQPHEILEWGWRIPMLVGCAIIPLLFVLRRSLGETPEFLARKTTPTRGEVVRSVGANWVTVVLGMMLSTMTTVSFYMITAYTPTFGGTTLGLETVGVNLVILAVAISSFTWLPLMGALSDRIGSRPLLLASASLALVTAYPALQWLVSAPSVTRLLLVELWFSFLYASYNGAMAPYLISLMPLGARTAGFSISFSLATAIFGGFTPAICTYLIEVTGNKAFPGVWLSFAALVGLTATMLTSRRRATGTALVPQANSE
jgi:MHS family citrate/tricarballylate:H+ symporter-like MFS transporter